MFTIVGVVQLPTDHSGIHCIPVIITHCAPLVVEADLYSSRTGWHAPSQPHFSLLTGCCEVYERGDSENASPLWFTFSLFLSLSHLPVLPPSLPSFHTSNPIPLSYSPNHKILHNLSSLYYRYMVHAEISMYWHGNGTNTFYLQDMASKGSRSMWTTGAVAPLPTQTYIACQCWECLSMLRMPVNAPHSAT